ncbi:SUKH-4 family immunity protein [Streptomyces sp. NPDC102360]|uniref:SUKH-4 family immunity protein n=1 Tax=Streptomyces sp. NPDC102360 TaxID=3366160 RepID=UPI0037F3C95E
MTVTSVGMPAEEVPGRVGAWWRAGGRGGSAAHVVPPDGVDAGAVLRRVHEDVPGSVLIDVTGLSSEQVMHEALTALGVDLSPGKRGFWPNAIGAWSEERLLVLVNTRRAGHTRRSQEPRRLLRDTVGRLATRKLAVLTDAGDRLLPLGLRPENLFHLAEPATDAPAPELPTALRALALAEPRTVPVPVWVQLVAALTGETMTPDELTGLAREHSDVLRMGPLGVSFADEGVAEALRRAVAVEQVTGVNGHLADWLLRSSADFRHPEGWARSGPVGLYAATGLAMHAVQAGTYEELLRDGRTVAHLPQTAFIDAARSHSSGIPGNSPAADALHLWGWGVVPNRQREWASWLHLMSWSRDDFAFAQAVASSGVALPWRTKWARWRPPGGCHARFLEAGRFSRLAEVRRQGRPAIAGLQKRMVGRSPEPYVSVRDAETGELLAGPWEGDEIPQGHRADLALPPPATTAPGASVSPDTEPAAPPTRLLDLFASSAPRRSERDFLMPCAPLAVGDVVVFGGELGLVAVQSADGVDPSDTFGLRQQPLSGDYSAPDPSSPVDAAPPSHRDLITLFGEDEIFEAEPEELPDELTHQPTRDLLTGFGLPDMTEGAMALLPYGDGDVDLLDEVDWPDDVEDPAEEGPFFRIGRWMGGELVVDGPTGRVLRVPTDDDPGGPDEKYLTALPAARDLETFLTMVALFVTGLRSRDLAPALGSERGQVTHWLLEALAKVDETGGGQPAWAYVIENE